MRVFVRAIERGTFAVAASDLGLTPSAVSKLVSRLEARLGVRLVNRTTRKLALTAEGETYFQSGRRLIEAVDGLEHEVAASAGRPRGVLRISTAVSFGVQHLTPALIEFHQRYPTCGSTCRSRTGRSICMPSRSTSPCAWVRSSDSSLVSHKFAEVERVICASPAYVARVRRARRARRISRAIAASSSPRRGAAAGPSGRRMAAGAGGGARPRSPATAWNASCSWRCRGAGIARLPDFMAARAIRAGDAGAAARRRSTIPRARRRLPCSSRARQKSPKVAVFLDFLIERFGREAWQLGKS